MTTRLETLASALIRASSITRLPTGRSGDSKAIRLGVCRMCAEAAFLNSGGAGQACSRAVCKTVTWHLQCSRYRTACSVCANRRRQSVLEMRIAADIACRKAATLSPSVQPGRW